MIPSKNWEVFHYNHPTSYTIFLSGSASHPLILKGIYCWWNLDLDSLCWRVELILLRETQRWTHTYSWKNLSCKLDYKWSLKGISQDKLLVVVAKNNPKCAQRLHEYLVTQKGMWWSQHSEDFGGLAQLDCFSNNAEFVKRKMFRLDLLGPEMLDWRWWNGASYHLI